MFKRLQRHAPSWLEQLPQLPDAIFASLQHPNAPDFLAGEEQRHRDKKQGQLQRQKRRILAGFALTLAVITAIPGGWQQLTNIPLVTWGLAALGLVMLLPRNDSR
jgi:ubiquinone biosynthesis protein